jgi:hypothetical protein
LTLNTAPMRLLKWNTAPMRLLKWNTAPMRLLSLRAPNGKSVCLNRFFITMKLSDDLRASVNESCFLKFLYSSSAYSVFPSHAIPKLRRCPLSGLMLQMRVAAAASSCLFTISNFVSSGVTCNLATSIRVSSRCAQL